MNKVLEEADDNGFNYDTRLDDGLNVLEKAVVFALQRNNVKSLQKLIDHSAEVEFLDVGTKFCFVQWALDRKKSPQNSTWDDNSKGQLKYMEAAKHWQKLITYATMQGTHFRVIAKEISQQYKVLSDHTRAALSKGDKNAQLEKQEKRLEHKLQEYIPRPSGQGNLARRPIHAQLRVAIFRYAHNKKKLDTSSFPENLGRVKQMALLESIYIELLGSAFRYRIGIHGPYQDLFFWNVLNNRFDLARVMWKQVDRPVEAALTAAFLLRNLGGRFESKEGGRPASERMLFNADLFENLAVRVFQAALEEDSALALLTVDCRLEIWNGLTLLDLAVKGGSYKFFEECCPDAIEKRLSGDLSRDHMDTKWGMLKLISGILSFGLLPAFFPKFLTWDPPPMCESVRRRTQRRKRPFGYPFNPSINPDIREKPGHFTDSNGRVVANKMTEDYSPQQLEKLWSKTFGLKERFKLFWSAPIVIFLSNALLTLVATIVFFIWFYFERLDPRLVVTQPDADVVKTDSSLELHWVEYFMACYFYLNIFREVFQYVTIADLRIYVFDFWNFFDLCSILTFAIGHYLRAEYIAQGNGLLQAKIFEKNSTEVKFSPNWPFVSGVETGYEAWAFFYSVSIFCLFLRLLRCLVISSMGLIVSIFVAMIKDVLQFMVIYILVVLGFSVIFLGISDPKSLINDCSHEPELYMKCIPSYFFFRTLFQSFGEFSLDDMGNSTSLFVLVVLFIITNILLMNLLVALMTSTYEQISNRAMQQRIKDHLDLIEEHLRCATALPVPVNLLVLLWQFIAFVCFHRDIYQQLHPDLGFWKQFDMFISSDEPLSTETRLDSRFDKDCVAMMIRACNTIDEDTEFGDSMMHGNIKHLLQVQTRCMGTSSMMHVDINHLLQMQKEQARKAPAARRGFSKLPLADSVPLCAPSALAIIGTALSEAHW
jgi:hypothetical protein